LTVSAVGCAPDEPPELDDPDEPLEVADPAPDSETGCGLDDEVASDDGVAVLDEPPLTLRLMPLGRMPEGSSPLAAANCSTLVPDRAAMAERVSPGATV
jgi:hypothetical protein